jgi:cyclin-dependent kinase regulatory subunit CKS1
MSSVSITRPDILTTLTNTGAMANLFTLYFSISNFFGDLYPSRHVILPKPMLKLLPKPLFAPNESGCLRILNEDEWRWIGITQSLGWEHYEVHGTLPLSLAAKRYLLRE